MKTAFLGITAAGIALACMAPLAAQTAARQEADMDVVPVLSVAGSGQARVTPDVANVRLGVLAQAETARAAQDQVNRAAGAIL
ncbi:MAG TPA: SIMPL domain-containing protein, partial [Thermoanaerobaculia bacterium]|nr:SIMPL domain-containing protein [Thermoanaerobaculia bacterium]